jgi:hypothetical protein
MKFGTRETGLEFSQWACRLATSRQPEASDANRTVAGHRRCPPPRQAVIAALDRSADGSAVDLLALETTAVARRFK